MLLTLRVMTITARLGCELLLRVATAHCYSALLLCVATVHSYYVVFGHTVKRHVI